MFVRLPPLIFVRLLELRTKLLLLFIVMLLPPQPALQHQPPRQKAPIATPTPQAKNTPAA